MGITAYMQIGGKIHTFKNGRVARCRFRGLLWYPQNSVVPYPVLDFDGTHALVIA